jgi:hypothetical protein
MSYESKLDKLIGERLAEYLDEQLLRHKLDAFMEQEAAQLTCGYPASVYHPKSLQQVPESKQFIIKPGGRLSNGVPKVLSGDIVDGYPLGLYNPRIH